MDNSVTPPLYTGIEQLGKWMARVGVPIDKGGPIILGYQYDNRLGLGIQT